MKAILFAALMASSVLVMIAVGQDKPVPLVPAPSKYVLTKEQSLELENLRLKAELLQRALQDAQRAFQQSLLDLTARAEKVKAENKWDAKTQFNPNDLSFSAPPPEKPAPEKKP